MRPKGVPACALACATQDAFAGLQRLATELNGMQLAVGAGGAPPPSPDRLLLTAKAHLKLGLWRRSLTEVCACVCVWVVWRGVTHSAAGLPRSGPGASQLEADASEKRPANSAPLRA